MQQVSRLRLTFVYFTLIALSALFVIPFVWLVTTSFKPESELFTRVWPKHWVVANYVEGVQHFPFLLYLRNTLTLCGLNVLGAVVSSSLVAYGLARIPWKGRHLLFAILLSTMMLPPQVTMVPLFAV